MGVKKTLRQATDRLASLEQNFIIYKASQVALIEELKERLSEKEELYLKEARKSRQLQDLLDQHKRDASELADNMRQKLSIVAQAKQEDLQKIEELKKQVRELQQELLEKDHMLQELQCGRDNSLDMKVAELEKKLAEKDELYFEEANKLRQFWCQFEEHRSGALEVVPNIRKNSAELVEEKGKESEKVEELEKQIKQLQQQLAEKDSMLLGPQYGCDDESKRKIEELKKKLVVKNEYCITEANRLRAFKAMFEEHKRRLSKLMNYVKRRWAKVAEEKRIERAKMEELKKEVRELQQMLIEKEHMLQEAQSCSGGQALNEITPQKKANNDALLVSLQAAVEDGLWKEMSSCVDIQDTLLRHESGLTFSCH